MNKYERSDLSIKDLQPVEILDNDLPKQVTELELDLANLEKTNRKIIHNNTYKQQLNNIDLQLPAPNKVDTEHIKKLQQQQAEHMKTVKDGEAFIKKLNNLHGVCPTCFSQIDSVKTTDLITERTEEIESARASAAALMIVAHDLEQQDKLYQNAVKQQQEWEKLHLLIDNTLPEKTLVKDDLQTKYENLAKSLKDTQQRIKQAEENNAKIQQHNSRVETIKQQLQEMNEELEEYSFQLSLMNERMSILQVLTKTFSTTGLVAYKIECLVKDLEEITNKYLVDLSDGRFQISFKVNSSDKLNVIITDNGKDIDINALSGGEKARVNVATLLSIRKLMQTLSSSRINLLVLDETVEALDVDGKEKLVEVLLGEEHLNTFLVSHGFSHPLLEKINVIKRNNISRIEG